jgi:hypothetical protein
MPAYDKKDEKADAPKASTSKKVDTSGSATNVRWSTDSTKNIRRSVTPSAETQSRNR